MALHVSVIASRRLHWLCGELDLILYVMRPDGLTAAVADSVAPTTAERCLATANGWELSGSHELTDELAEFCLIHSTRLRSILCAGNCLDTTTLLSRNRFQAATSPGFRLLIS